MMQKWSRSITTTVNPLAFDYSYRVLLSCRAHAYIASIFALIFISIHYISCITYTSCNVRIDLMEDSNAGKDMHYYIQHYLQQLSMQCCIIRNEEQRLTSHHIRNI
ncbi:hypothetical protein GQX74_004583 [Glossina fuscipes]|nr:hypothetical protein GQX74_004583 [Glossina fuscipes]